MKFGAFPVRGRRKSKPVFSGRGFGAKRRKRGMSKMRKMTGLSAKRLSFFRQSVRGF